MMMMTTTKLKSVHITATEALYFYSSRATFLMSKADYSDEIICNP